MQKYGITNINIVLADRVLENGSIIFSNKIEQILPYTIEGNRVDKLINGKAGFLTPGLIDIHIHGAGGKDTMDGELRSIEVISSTLAKYGTTSFLPTTMTMPPAAIKKALTSLRQAMQEGTSGARVVGAHAEGPFISKKYIGAQDSNNILSADAELLAEFYDLVKIMTLAPEEDGAGDLIRKLRSYNIIASVGHSAATYEELLIASETGLAHATHLFNAMSGLHHRQPGLVGGALDTDLTVELITDLIHLHPAIIRLAIKAKGVDKIILVSDAMEACGLSEGKYELGGQKVIVKDGAARLENGSLAGSVLTLDQAIRNVLSVTDLRLDEVIRMATLNPARRIGIDLYTGRIKRGLAADLVLFNEQMQVEQVYISGKLV